MATPRLYSAPCAWGCGTTVTSRLRIPSGGIGCGQGACLEAHNASADQRRSRQGTTRRPARQPVVIPGGWAEVGQILGGLSRKGQQ